MKTAADYGKIRKTLHPEPSRVLSKEYIHWLKSTSREGNTVHWFMIGGFFWHPRELLGIEPHLFSFYDEPDLLKEICRDQTEWLKKLFEYLGNTVQFDFMTFAEDMSYNHGPMLGKKAFDEFIAPWYRELVPLLKKMDMPVFVDSDGDITKAVDWYAELGVEGMSPLERQAGTSLAACIEKHPEMTFMGHFDKLCMKHGEPAMRKEFEYLIPYCQKGKVIISVDHQTPPEVSLENYRTFVRLFKEYAS
jgi:uroporphyrinogen-III decarboxylase